MNEYTIDEVQKHNTKDNCWIVIDNDVYNITEFLDIHPGGSSIIMQLGGDDVTEYFHELHNPSILKEYNSLE